MALNFHQYRDGYVRGRSLDLYYWNGWYNEYRGVYYLQSDSVSEDKRGRSAVADMGYFFAYDCNSSGILGHEHSTYFGRVRDLFPDQTFSCASNFQHGCVLPQGMRHIRAETRDLETDDLTMHHAWVFHSQERPAADGVHAPVNFFWQDPSMVSSDTYNCYLLMDVHDPADWQEARLVYLNGAALVVRTTLDDRISSVLSRMVHDDGGVEP